MWPGRTCSASPGCRRPGNRAGWARSNWFRSVVTVGERRNPRQLPGGSAAIEDCDELFLRDFDPARKGAERLGECSESIFPFDQPPYFGRNRPCAIRELTVPRSDPPFVGMRCTSMSCRPCRGKNAASDRTEW